jgi:hypothetical protein
VSANRNAAIDKEWLAAEIGRHSCMPFREPEGDALGALTSVTREHMRCRITSAEALDFGQSFKVWRQNHKAKLVRGTSA